MEDERVPVQPPHVLMVARMPRADVPAVVGVPLTTPLEALRESPAGSDPEDTDHVLAGEAGDATIDIEYAVPTVPAVKLAGVTVIAGQEEVMRWL